MKLENRVCSLELSKRLEKLGVKQESLWWWVNHWDSYIEDRDWNIFQKDEDDKVNEHISAFTVAELGEMLPYKIITKGEDYYFNVWKEMGNKFVCEYTTADNQVLLQRFVEFTEANARAKMLVYLIENKLMEVK